MIRGLQGTPTPGSFVGERYTAFVPRPLPPDPPLALESGAQDLLEQANRALGRLDGMSIFAPEWDSTLLLYFYVRKEAVLSSQIEGAQSSLSDLLLYEAEELPGVPLDDVREVSSYVAALNHGIARLEEGAALTSRLIREVHGVLLATGRGSNQRPGEFRQSQNWIGGTRPGNARFVPPPYTEIVVCMSALEKFIHDEPRRTPTLIKAALAHVQFETIHPFLDGNGRVGRLLIALLLHYEKALSVPLLYLSLYFKTHRQQYYELLQRVRQEGVWEEWLSFFLTGVRDTAEAAARVPLRVTRLFEEDASRIQSLGRAGVTALRMHQHARKSVLFSIPAVAQALGISHQAASTAVNRLVELDILREVGERRRNRLFVYQAYLDILEEGTRLTGVAAHP